MKLGNASEWAKELIEYGSNNSEHLTEWQQDFLSDYGEKVENFEEGCYISDKQLNQLNKIAELLGLEECDSSDLDYED